MIEFTFKDKVKHKQVIDYNNLRAGDQIEYGKTVSIRVSMGEEPTSQESTMG